jgi:hypothetical protein
VFGTKEILERLDRIVSLLEQILAERRGSSASSGSKARARSDGP